MTAIMLQEIEPLTRYQLWAMDIDPSQCHEIAIVLDGNQKEHDESECFDDWRSHFWVHNWPGDTENLFHTLGDRIVEQIGSYAGYWDPLIDFRVEEPLSGNPNPVMFFGLARKDQWSVQNGASWG